MNNGGNSALEFNSIAFFFRTCLNYSIHRRVESHHRSTGVQSTRSKQLGVFPKDDDYRIDRGFIGYCRLGVAVSVDQGSTARGSIVFFPGFSTSHSFPWFLSVVEEIQENDQASVSRIFIQCDRVLCLDLVRELGLEIHGLVRRRVHGDHVRDIHAVRWQGHAQDADHGI